MKKIFLGTVLAVSSLFVSCEKASIQKTLNEQVITPSTEKIDNKNYTTIACETIDAEGNKGIGSRCRRAKGDDCSKETACSSTALSTSFVLPDGWSLDQFNDAWNTEDGKKYLESLGYYQRDLE